MKESPKNIAASVRARLLSVAKQTNQDNNAVVNRYAQERFLYRLSISPFRENFILKGALLLLPYNLPVTRPTRDVDFLGKGFKNDPVVIQNIIKQIISFPADDGIHFETEDVTTESITEQDEYNGARCKVAGNVGGITFSIQIDIGFSDDIIPNPNTMDFPVILDHPVPHLKVYSLESAIAEKFEAMVSLNLLTSRMKDFYDIIFLARNHSFKADILHQAIIATFTRRETNIDDAKVIFSDEFINDARMQRQWDAFVQRQDLDRNEKFPTVVKEIKNFLKPVTDKKNK
ncbi:MAG: nucleotidyl transferase AbiEii/AbiGii toxin family protein [Bacteroidota bacterium]|nr:nucleotidyl transferase AbiEii/AbiGii toxin family protein [Bacteroidota bacterium]